MMAAMGKITAILQASVSSAMRRVVGEMRDAGNAAEAVAASIGATRPAETGQLPSNHC